MVLTEDTRIARHEAAHAIAALEFGGTVQKIDLDAQNSPNGLGAAHVSHEDPRSLAGQRREQLTMIALIVICAGAANDALELSELLQTAWSNQAGDQLAATNLLVQLGVPTVEHDALIEKALDSASDFVKSQRCAIIFLGKLVVRKRVVRDKEIMRCYRTHKVD